MAVRFQYLYKDYPGLFRGYNENERIDFIFGDLACSSRFSVSSRTVFITRKNKHRPVDHYKTGLTWFDIHGVSEYGTKAETNRSETVFKAIHCTASHRTSSPAA